MTEGPERLLNRFKPEVEHHLRTLKGLVRANGGVSASIHGGYMAHWIRDGLYVLKAFEYMGLREEVTRMIKFPMEVFQRHASKLETGIKTKPGDNFQFLHARYHPHTLNELEQQWGHNQLDMLGIFLFEVADLKIKAKINALARPEDREIVNLTTRYLESLKWWDCPDFGVWEEGPELHSSSIGSVLAGLQRLKTLDEPGTAFNHEQLVFGRKALDSLLPRESKSDSTQADRNKPFDLAQLGLIWPYKIVNEEQERIILGNIEQNLLRKHGVARYDGDAYFNSSDPRLKIGRDSITGLEVVSYDPEGGHYPHRNKGSEAEWPLGFGWLSIAYSKIAKRKFEREEDNREEKAKAEHYLEALASQAVSNGEGQRYFPELYVGDKPNLNTPLAWPTSFYIVAARSFLEIENRFVPLEAK